MRARLRGSLAARRACSERRGPRGRGGEGGTLVRGEGGDSVQERGRHAGGDVPGCGCAKRLGYTSWRAGGSNLPAVRALVAMLAVGVAGAGCGGGSFDEQPPAKPGIYTSLAIAQHFKRETGDTLVPGRVRGRGL